MSTPQPSTQAARILERGASLVVASHLGRPRGEVLDDLSLAPVSERLGGLLERTVEFVPYVSGEGVAGPTADTSVHADPIPETVPLHVDEQRS